LRDLLYELVARDMKLRYKRAVLGALWSLLNPLAQVIVFSFVFSKVLSFQIPNYPLFVTTGVLVWSWFQTALTAATEAITENPDLVRRPGFPVAVLPVIPVTSQMIHFLLALAVFVLYLPLAGERLHLAVLALPLVVGTQFVLTLSLAYLVAVLHVTFRDTKYLLGVFLMIFFYVNPILYATNAVPARYRPLYDLNPLARVIGAYRGILLEGRAPSPISLLLLIVPTTALLLVTRGLFVRASRRFVEEL
jgi:lipopolysaccharide transport system permease protein